MCGRFSLTQEPIALIEGLQLFDARESSLIPRYNIAPTQEIVTVIEPTRGNRRLGHLRWGLIPFWADDPGIGNRLINARSETAHTKPAFRDSFRLRRCLVAADGFYEWQRIPGGTSRQPYRVVVEGEDGEEVLAFAGLWDRWKSPEGETSYSCTILTTNSSDGIKTIHDRMPVILDLEGMKTWLNPEVQSIDKLTSLLKPFSSEALRAYRVSTRVNSPANDTPEVIRPLPANAH